MVQSPLELDPQHHPAYAHALAQPIPPPPTTNRLLVGLGGAVSAILLLLGATEPDWQLLVAAPFPVVIMLAVCWRGLRAELRRAKAPVTRALATIVSRRQVRDSWTSYSTSNTHTHVTWFFTLRFADGRHGSYEVAEVTQLQQLPDGTTGLAVLRGDLLAAFHPFPLPR